MPEIKIDLFAIGPENTGLPASLIAHQLMLTTVVSARTWPGWAMSALGQKPTFAARKGMSALPLKADMCARPVRRNAPVFDHCLDALPTSALCNSVTACAS